MTYVQAFLSQELVTALGWTILHSLWQGALVALALSILLVFLNRQSAQVRYFISLTALFTTLALAVFTFWSIYQAPAESTTIATVSGPTFSAENLSVSPQAEVIWTNKLENFFVPYFEKHLPLLVTLWFMGMLVMALRMLGGLAYVQRLKHYQTQPLGIKWQHKLEDLRTRLDMKKPVLLLESLQVKVPMAIGYLKPVILVPFGAVNGLSEKQVEAILAHELAHIFRHDYLFNLVQAFVETLFFYHPAMWWMSACVRAERENCCDDIAISLCGDTLTFAEALTELEGLNTAYVPNLAMAFSGKKGSLLSRIKRLVSQPKRSASFTEGFLAACIVMVSISVISLSAMAQLGPKSDEFPIFLSKGMLLAKNDAPAEEESKPESWKPEHSTTSQEQKETASIALNNQLLAQAINPAFNSEDYALYISKAPDADGKDIIIVKDKKGRIAELYVDGKKVRKKDMPALEKVIAERSGIPVKSKKKEYASKEDVAEAKQALTENSWRQNMHPNPKVYVYSNPEAVPFSRPGTKYRYQYRYNTPAPPNAPAPPAVYVMPDGEAPMAPIPPVRPMKPMRPMQPMAPIAPRADDSEEERKEYEQDLNGYWKEMRDYEKEMAEFNNSDSEEWKEFEQEMTEFGKEMADYGKEMADYMKYNVHVDIRDDKRDENRRERTIERSLERSLERSAEARARGAEERAKAAEIRAKALEAGAKARAEAAKERAKAAEIRAKEAVVRNERMEKLKAELRKDKLIGENTTDFSYKINKDGLYVNDKKQSQDLFEKYKKLFHPGLANNSAYNETYIIKNDGKSRNVTITSTTNDDVKDKDKDKTKDTKIKAKAKTDKKN